MSQQPEYFGGTPTSSTGYRKPGKSIFQGILDDMQETSWWQAGAAATEFLGKVAGTTFGVVDSATAPATASGLGAAAAKATAAAGGQPINVTGDASFGASGGTAGPPPGLLTQTLGGAEAVWSYGVARPASTGMLLADPNSPLYRDGTVDRTIGVDENGKRITEVVPVEAGFQLGDVGLAWERSGTVSFGRSSAGNTIAQSLPGYGTLTALGDVRDYDPWSDYDMSQADNNPYYTFLTGATDTALAVVVPPAAKVARLAAMEKAGLRTTIRSVDDLTRLREDFGAHQAWKGNTSASTGATPARKTTYGTLIDDLAETTNIGDLKKNTLIANADGVDKGTLAHILQRVDDPSTVNEIILASRGDEIAMRNLMNAAPDYVWELADMNAVVRSRWMSGERFAPEGEQLATVNQMFDSALARDEFFRDVRTAFTSESGFPRGGATWMPTESVIVESIRTGGRKTEYAIKSGDYSDMPRWVERTAQSRVGAPVTRFLQWTGSRQPLGMVSNSGARPDDMWLELSAQLDAVPILRGNRSVVVGEEIVNGEVVPVRVPATEYRAQILQRLADADSTGYLKPQWQAIEDEIVVVMADTLGLDRAKAAELVAGYRRSIDETFSYMNNNGGYLFDEGFNGQPARIITDPVSRRQMLDSFVTLPLDEIFTAMNGELSTFLRVGSAVQGSGINLFDAGMKLFRTNTLFRPGYTGKNSIMEPAIASWLAHGTVLADEGLTATFRNFGRNRANDLARVGYMLRLNRMIRTASKDAPELARELTTLVQQRHATQRVIDDLVALADDMKSGRVSPSMAEQYSDEVRGRLVEAQMRMDTIEAALDGKLPEWRQVVEPASLPDLQVRLREFQAMAGTDTAFIREIDDEIADIEQAALSRMESPTARQRRAVDQLQQRIDDVDSRLQKLEVDYNNPDGSDVTSIGVAESGAQRPMGGRGTDKDIARGRDLQAISLQRQRESLVQQRDEALDELRRMDEAGVDAFVEPQYTVNEARSLENLRATRDRIQQAQQDMSPEIREQIQTLQQQYDDTIAIFRSPASDPTRSLQDLQKSLDAIDRKIESVQRQQGVAVARRDRVSGMRGYAGSGDGYMTVYVGSERIQVPSAFSTTPYEYGAAYRNEASAATTNALTFDPSYRASASMLRWKMAGGPQELLPTDPTYWPELEHVVNRYFRGDKLIQQVLEAPEGPAGRAAIARWLVTPEGRAYQRTMGKNYLVPRERSAPAKSGIADTDPSTAERVGDSGRPRSKTFAEKIPAPRRRNPRVILESTTELDDVIRLVNQYLPDPKVRQTAAAREMTAGELQEALGGRSDLSRIVGEDLAYNANPVSMLGNWLNDAGNKIWQFIATLPEDRLFRWPFYQREFKAQLQNRINVAVSQGARMSPSSGVQELRQAAHRATLAQLEKTFYNIRRYNTPIYTSRFLMSFPGAFFNSFYRYGRFAVREPERTLQSAVMAGNALSSVAVDENGDPVGRDLSRAAYLLVPGTKRDANDYGIQVPVAAFDSLVIGYPGLSYLATVGVSSVLRQKPDAEESLKKALGPFYDEVFPFGVPRNPASAMFGGWQKDAYSAAADYLNITDERFLQTNVQIHADNMAQWEKNNRAGEPPTFQDAIDETRAFYMTRAGMKFWSPVTVNQRVPGQLMRDAWYEMRANAPDNIEGAREQYMQMYGEWARWYTYSSSDYTSYIPSTQDAYKRVWQEFPDLTREVVSLLGDDISLVGLIALGTGGDFSASVNNFMRDNPLPGDDVPVASRMTPEQFDNMVRVSDGWTMYFREKAKYDAERARLVELRDGADSKQEKAYYSSWVKATDSTWDQTVDEMKRYNEPWAVDRTNVGGDKAQRTVYVLNKIMKNKRFMDGPGKDPLWQKIDQFLVDRQAALAYMKTAESAEDRASAKSQFYEHVIDTFAKDDAPFAEFFDRYFSSEWVEQ